MMFSIAPIIHARTKDVDFRSNLLVVPEDFSPDDVQWARKYIVDSTRYFELAGTVGRNVVFSNDTYIVSGISIRIGDLYRLCEHTPQYEKVDGNRTNYAFIGLVFPKNQLMDPIDIPLSLYLETFEKYMALRWNDANVPAALLHTKAKYEMLSFPNTDRVSTLLQAPSGSYPQVINIQSDSIESIVAQARLLAWKHSNFAFCSDIPTATCVIESNFSAVTSANAKSINDVLGQQAETSKQSHTGSGTPTQNKSGKSEIDILQDISSQHRGHNVKKPSAMLVALYAIVGCALLAVVIFLLVNHR